MNAIRHTELLLTTAVEKRPLREVLHITGYTFSEMGALVVTLKARGHTGRGEAEGVYYHQETPQSMQAQVEALRGRIESGITREELLELLPAGGARNALDCALWELEANQSGQPAWKLAGIDQPVPLTTTFTIGVNHPSRMAEEARNFSDAIALKLKLADDEHNAERVKAVREARPDTWIMVDANQGFTPESLGRLTPTLLEARIALVEQPFPIDKEEWLDGLDHRIPVAVDESVQDRSDLARFVDRVETINIKLDKCGGLTEGLAMARQARELGFKLMVGNMCGSSLAMAPAFVLGQMCEVVDLDGPISLREDFSPGVRYEHGRIWCPGEIWGGPSGTDVPVPGH